MRTPTRRRCGAPMSTAFPLAASAAPRRSRAPSSSSRRRARATSPARSSSSTAVSPSTERSDMPRTEILVEGLDHPEGVCWDPASGALWAGGEAGQIYRIDLAAGSAEEAARAPGFVLGLAVDGRGRLAACAGDGL